MLQTQSTTIEQAYKLFMLDNRARRFTSATLAWYRHTLTLFIAYCTDNGAMFLYDLSPSIIRLYLVSMQERNLADSTIHGAARSIRTFLNFCVKEEILHDTPMRMVTMPRLQQKLLPAFELEDVRRLLDYADRERDRAIIYFLLDTGVRAAEMVKLDGGDLDMETGTVLVRCGKQQKDRIVYISPRTVKQMLRYYIICGRPEDNEAVFRSLHGGTRLTGIGLRQMLIRLGKASRVKYCHPHTFRRTFALWSLRAGMPLPHVQRLMGHADISTTQKYLRLLPDDIRNAHAEYSPVASLLA